MSVNNQNSIDDGEELEIEFILSLCWDNGNLSAVYYNLLTLELHVNLLFCPILCHIQFHSDWFLVFGFR